MKYYRIIRERDGHVDGDYCNSRSLKAALKYWKLMFPEDNFIVSEGASRGNDRYTYYKDMEDRGLTLPHHLLVVYAKKAYAKKAYEKKEKAST